MHKLFSGDVQKYFRGTKILFINANKFEGVKYIMIKNNIFIYILFLYILMLANTIRL